MLNSKNCILKDLYFYSHSQFLLLRFTLATFFINCRTCSLTWNQFQSFVTSSCDRDRGLTPRLGIRVLVVSWAVRPCQVRVRHFVTIFYIFTENVTKHLISYLAYFTGLATTDLNPYNAFWLQNCSSNETSCPTLACPALCSIWRFPSNHRHKSHLQMSSNTSLTLKSRYRVHLSSICKQK